MQRILLVGTSGSGKSTLGKQLSERLSIAHIELDSIYWQPGWTTTADDLFMEKVQQRLSETGGRWIIDGNYSRVQSVLLGQADTLVWLDYPLALILWRITRRTFRRVFLREKLWNGNVETFRSQFMSKDSMLLWVLQTHRRRIETYTRLMASRQYPHLTFIRLRSPAQTDTWLRSLQLSV